MNVIHLKILSLVVLFIVMTTCGLIPVIAVRKGRSANFREYTSPFISICNCVSGGVFMGMCFLGIFPYVREKWQEVLESADLKITFPVAEFMVLLGFFIFLTIEQSVMILRTKNDSGESASKNVSMKMSEVDLNDFAEEEKKCEDESHTRLLETSTPESDIRFDPKSKSSLNLVLKPGKHSRSKKRLGSDSQAGDGSLKKSYCGHSHAEVVFSFEKESSLKNIIFMLAMSVHTLFEGMALGLQTDSAKVLHLFLAILIHESLVMVALGVNVAKYNLGVTTSLKYVILVTIGIPIGIVLGMLCETTPGLYGKVISALVQGLSAGIFIHVIFMELIPEEFFSSTANRLFKVLYFFVGFMCMAIVSLFLGDHDH